MEIRSNCSINNLVVKILARLWGASTAEGTDTKNLWEHKERAGKCEGQEASSLYH
jgi:hypothetical protein